MSINDVYSQRVLHLRDACLNSTDGFWGFSTDDTVGHNLHFDQNHNLLYCQIQKVGSTFMRKLLSKVIKDSTASKTKTSLMRLKNWKDLGFLKLHSVIQNSDKFMFVRDPYSRVLSGYVDKLFCPNEAYQKTSLGAFIVSEIREDASSLSLHCGHDVTFPEFVKYIILSEKRRIYRDRHFTPMYEHCRPCQIPYDFIGKFESFKKDISFLIDVWNKGYGTNIIFDDFEAKTAATLAKRQCERLFQMRAEMKPCMTFYNASVRFWRDMQIRGILPIQKSFPFSTEYTINHMTEEDLFMAIKKTLSTIDDITSVKNQRTEALIEAYSLVTMEDLYGLQTVIQPDCLLFNYDCRPPNIFDRKGTITPLKYFNL